MPASIVWPFCGQRGSCRQNTYIQTRLEGSYTYKRGCMVSSWSPMAHSRLSAGLSQKLVARPTHIAWLPHNVSSNLNLQPGIPISHVRQRSTRMLCSDLHVTTTTASCILDHPHSHSSMGMREGRASNPFRGLSRVQSSGFGAHHCVVPVRSRDAGTYLVGCSTAHNDVVAGHQTMAPREGCPKKRGYTPRAAMNATQLQPTRELSNTDRVK